MLTRLKITNFLLIEELELDFHSGLTVVTGETGSGKSIIIDALMLLFGARVSKDIIRDNKEVATFEAEFSLSNIEAIKWLQENDLIDIDNPKEIICRRIIDYQGKNKAYINGNAVTGGQIKLLGDLILDIHTQHASVTLLKPETQRNLLDEYAKIRGQTEKLSGIFKVINEIKDKLNLALNQSRDLELKQQILKISINELSELNLSAGEWQNLDTKHKELANADSILSELDFAQTVLQEQDESTIKQIRQLNSRLSKIAINTPQLNDITTILSSVEIELQELCYSIAGIANKIEQNPVLLSELEMRINQIFDLSRKYRIQPEHVVEQINLWQEELASLTEGSNVANLELRLEQLQKEYKLLAQEISKARFKSAKELGVQVTEYLLRFAIIGEFRVELQPLKELSSYGLETVEYQVCFNKGLAYQSLVKAASGGELSRTALALYLLLSIHNPPEIIIFDEIDVGIGGKVASIVGEMLRRLGRVKQVICITHQPQTASFGDKHLSVSKHNKQKITQVEINYVEGTERIDEVARMLGGVKITPTTLSHAAEMLENIGN